MDNVKKTTSRLNCFQSDHSNPCEIDAKKLHDLHANDLSMRVNDVINWINRVMLLASIITNFELC
jgi:hypothetical protein